MAVLFRLCLPIRGKGLLGKTAFGFLYPFDETAQLYAGRILIAGLCFNTGSAGCAVIVCSTYSTHQCPLRSEEHTSELQSRGHLVCRLLLETKKIENSFIIIRLLIF